MNQSFNKAVTFGGPAPWVAPTEDIDPDDLAKVIAFLEGQSRIDLAIWAGIEFPVHVQHQVACRLVGRRPNGEELQALYWGILETLPTKCYLEFPIGAKMQEIEAIGTPLWRRTEPTKTGLDPLAFHCAYEPVDVPPSVIAEIAAIGARFPSISRISARRSFLWKGPELVRERVNVTIDYGDSQPPPGSGPFPALTDALTSHFRASGESVGVSVGRASKSSAARTLYHRTPASGAA